MSQLLPFSEHMYMIGWSIREIRCLMRSYVLTLPTSKEQWASLVDYLNDMDTSGKLRRCVPPDVVGATKLGNCALLSEESGLEGWLVSTTSVEGEGELGMDVVDNTVETAIELVAAEKEEKGGAEGAEGAKGVVEKMECPRMIGYSATVSRLRPGPAIASGMLGGGVIVAIEGRSMEGRTFIEIIHCLKEASLLRPFDVTLTHRCSAAKVIKVDEMVVGKEVVEDEVVLEEGAASDIVESVVASLVESVLDGEE